ncbi:MAG: DegV family EDD domain-containing protein [Lachnospiraceae bacterium]|nr:DegV family EDD domain-containing protein [Lachnospiraceae bacterium]
MNTLKDWLEKIKDPARDVYERRYRVFTPIGVATVAIWLVIVSVLDFDLLRFSFFSAMLAAYVLSIVWTLRTNRIRAGAAICAIGMIFGLMPFVFFTEGGISAGAFNYCITSLVFVLMTLDGKLRRFFLFADLLVVSACITIGYLYPELVRTQERQISYLNAVTEMAATFIMVFSSLMFQFYIFHQERSILEQQRNEIEELNRSQNRFFSSMSHEIRTPINTIIGLNEMNMRDQSLSEEAYANNRNIQGASNMLLALINDILDMSKIESGKMDIVPVAYETGTMLSEIVNMIWGRAHNKGLAFAVEVDPALPVRLYGDEVRIKQVLINLLNNAVKYTQEGSVTLKIQCDRTEESRVRVTYRVEDTGMGIKKEALPDLFDAFKRVDQEANRNIEGTGLGLSIVKQIVDLMDGEITVDSVYTRGSTFSVSFLQEIVDAAEIGELSLSASKTAAKRDVYLQRFEAPAASLLIVDDNELNLQVESKLLAATKMQIDLAMSGRECLSMTLRKKYDVIFMDHLMPEMDGIETLKEVRTQQGGLNRDTKVLALTANAGSENQALYTREGFDGYLVKPVTGDQLENALLDVLPKEKINLTGAATVHAERETITGQHRRSKYIAVSCESGADIPESVLRKFGIAMINSLIRTNESLFYDNLDIESDGLLDYLDVPGNRAESEPPTVEAYERFYAQGLAKAQNLVHISIGSGVAKDYAIAKAAADSFDHVYVVDSENISAGTGLLVLYAAYLAEREDNITRFLELLEQVRHRIRSSFIVDSTEYLARGGRISKGLHTWMQALMLHPVLKMRKDALKPAGIYAGERAGYRRRYIRNALKPGGAIDESLLIVVYAGMPAEERMNIRKTIEDCHFFRRIVFVKASGAVSVNSGRGSFALVYCMRTEEGEGGLFDFLPAELGNEKEGTTWEETLLKAEDAPREAETPGEAEAAAKDAVPAEAKSDLQKLYDGAPALQYTEALKILGGEELLEKTLRMFYENIGKNADELERMLEADDYENFTIKVHALKSSAHMIGAGELSELARRLEEYGKLIRL